MNEPPRPASRSETILTVLKAATIIGSFLLTLSDHLHLL